MHAYGESSETESWTRGARIGMYALADVIVLTVCIGKKSPGTQSRCAGFLETPRRIYEPLFGDAERDFASAFLSVILSFRSVV